MGRQISGLAKVTLLSQKSWPRGGLCELRFGSVQDLSGVKAMQRVQHQGLSCKKKRARACRALSRHSTDMDLEHAHLLVVDDDPELRELTQAYLQQQGFEVATADCGESMDAYLNRHQVDLLILDLMLPGEHGLSIAQRLKKRQDLPIIIVSAQGDDIDRIVGLEVGADDYLSKPFNPRELLARVRAVLRRSSRAEVSQESTPAKVQFGEFSLDLASHRLTQDGVGVSLTSGEFDLLAILVSHPNKVLHRDRILDLLTGAERSPFDRSIDVRVTRLRSKLETDPANPLLIKTIWGKGYMFCPNPDD